MTGIERLRGVAGFWRENKLDDIVEQIEREQGGRVSRMRVLSVVTEMERHVSGVEGMDDSPVARWARELREALGGDGRAPTGYVSVSAYDLMPEEDREAAAWVRKHGGLDHVRSQWGYLKGRAGHADRVDRALARRQRQIDECHAALRRRNEERDQYVEANKRLLEREAELHRQLLKAQGDALEKDYNLAETKNDIREVCLAHGIDVPSGGYALDAIDMRLHDMNEALSKRLMPEGMEWPRFEDGEPVRIGSEFGYGTRLDAQEVTSILFTSEGCFIEPDYSWEGDDYVLVVEQGQRVRRPAPKVLDAEGVEIRKGDRVWSLQLDEPHEWIVIDPHEDREDSQTVLVSIGDRTGQTGHARPSDLTHRAPVLAADGRPLREGETVYLIDSPTAFVVDDIMTREDGTTVVHLKDGAWHLPQYLTHERPDSWERLEEDVAGASCPDVYCVNHHVDASDTSYEWAMARDIMRRAKKLAGVDND